MRMKCCELHIQHWVLVPHCRVHQTYRALPHGLLWHDSACGTSPPSLQQSWWQKQTKRVKVWIQQETDKRKGMYDFNWLLQIIYRLFCGHMLTRLRVWWWCQTLQFEDSLTHYPGEVCSPVRGADTQQTKHYMCINTLGLRLWEKEKLVYLHSRQRQRVLQPVFAVLLGVCIQHYIIHLKKKKVKRKLSMEEYRNYCRKSEQQMRWFRC